MHSGSQLSTFLAFHFSLPHSRASASRDSGVPLSTTLFSFTNILGSPLWESWELWDIAVRDGRHYTKTFWTISNHKTQRKHFLHSGQPPPHFGHTVQTRCIASLPGHFGQSRHIPHSRGDSPVRDGRHYTKSILDILDPVVHNAFGFSLFSLFSLSTFHSRLRGLPQLRHFG